MNRSLLQAFVIAPLVAPFLYIIGDIFFTVTGISVKHDLLGNALAVLLFTTPISYLTTAVLGIPFYFLLKKLNRLTKLNLIIGGAIIGIFSLTLLFSLVMPPMAWELSDWFWLSGVGAILGSSVAWCFYVLLEE